MTFSINTHDAWGIVKVGCFTSLEEAREAFSTLCQDPWYQRDGGVKGLELVDDGDGNGGDRGRGGTCGLSLDADSGARRLAWFSPRA